MLRPGLILALSATLLGCTADEAPRILSVGLLQDTGDAHGPYRVLAIIDDERRLEGALVRYETDGAAGEVAMHHRDGQAWSAELPAFPLGTTVRYAVEARDRRQVTLDPPRWPDAAHVFVVGNVPSRPEIVTLWPERGPTSGGTEVLLVGRDFRDGPVVRFGTGTALVLEVVSKHQVRVVVPPGPEGPVDVTLTNRDGGQAVLARGFVYFPSPEVDSVVPPSGPTAGGTAVVIRGRRFAPGATFLFGGRPARDVVIRSEGEATAVTPPNAAGAVAVAIEHPTLGRGERPNAYTYVPPPEVLSIDPARGPDLGGTSVVITGRGFVTGATVHFDGAEAREVRVLSPSQIAAITPSHPVGPADVVVQNPDRQVGTLPRGFFFFGPPVLSRIEPPHAAVDGGAQVAVFGQNFEPGSRVSLALSGGPVNLSCTYTSSERLSCTTPRAPAGPAEVTVTNSDGRSATRAEAITFFEVLQVRPDRGPSAGGTDVIVRGRFFPRSLASVRFGAAASRCTWLGAAELACVTPPGPPDQFVDVGALPPEPGQVPAVLARGFFYVAPPRIDAITPDRGPLRGGVRITLRGDFFQSGARVLIGATPCQNVVVVNAQTIQCTVPAGQPGRVPVTVENPDGQRGSRDGFTYVPVTLEPSWGLVDGFTSVTLRGEGFAPGAVVTFGSQTLPATFISAREVRVRTTSVPATGSAQVVVANPGDTPEVSPERFSYRAYRDRSHPSMAGNGETADLMIVDLDGDGDNDLVFVNGWVGLPERSQILENRGGTFVARGIGVNQIANEGGWCDMDGDGRPDLIWGITGGPTQLFRNDGNFVFTPRTLPGNPVDAFEAGFFDVTGNGACDVVHVGISTPNLIFRNDGAGNFTPIPNAVPHEFAFEHDHKVDVGDLDGDGFNDLVIVVDDINFGVRPAQRHRIYLNDGTHRFTEDLRNRSLLEQINGDIYDVRIGDIDGDGDLDIVMPNYERPPVVLLNDGTGRFTRVTDRLPNQTRHDTALLLVDIEGDGDLDLYLVSLDNRTPSALFLNDGRGFFHRATRGEPQGAGPAYRAAFGDIDGDGRGDLIAGSVFGPNRMWFPEE